MTHKKIPDETYWRGQKPVADLILKKIKKNNNILEIGIGKGGVTKYLLQKQPYVNIVGFDINVSSLKQAKIFFKTACKGEVKVFKMSQDVNLIKKFGKEKFDFVISSGVMDYAKDPIKVLKGIRNILKPGGYFAFTLFDNKSSIDYDGKSPKQRYVSSVGIKTWGFRDSYIRKLLSSLGLRILKMMLRKKLHKNLPIELSYAEINAVKNNLDTPYEDHFVILVRKK